jgi:hypothetical protein
LAAIVADLGRVGAFEHTVREVAVYKGGLVRVQVIKAAIPEIQALVPILREGDALYGRSEELRRFPHRRRLVVDRQGGS